MTDSNDDDLDKANEQRRPLVKAGVAVGSVRGDRRPPFYAPRSRRRRAASLLICGRKHFSSRIS
jgi:hypothetical protein